MTQLAALSIDNSIELDNDVVIGGGYERIDHSDIYGFTVEYAYLRTAGSGALGLVLHMKSDGGANFRETMWMTSGTAKGGNNFYVDKNGKKQYLPGFTNANNLALLTVGKNIGELETEEKVAKLYDYEQQAEVPTKVQMFTDLVNQPIKAGILKQIVDRNVKNDAGAYVPSGETREEYIVDKFFRARDNMTVAEILAQADEASFHEVWIEKNKDREVNRAKGAQGGAAPAAPTPAAPSAAGSAPVASLFG